MKLKWVGLLAAIPLMQPAEAPAKTAAHSKASTPLKALLLADGECQKLMLPGYDFTRGCDGHLANEVYANGRTGFTFTMRTGPVVTFSGIAPQVKQGPDAAIQPIDVVIWNFGSGAHPIPNPVVGRCKFTNPFKGQATVSCTATSKDGEFIGEFVTDGSPPSERTF